MIKIIRILVFVNLFSYNLIGNTEECITRNRKNKKFANVCVRNGIKAKNLVICNSIRSCSRNKPIFTTFGTENPKLGSIRTTFSFIDQSVVVTAGSGMIVNSSLIFNTISVLLPATYYEVTFSVSFSNTNFFSEVPSILLTTQTTDGPVARSFTSGNVISMASAHFNVSKVTTKGFQISVAIDIDTKDGALDLPSVLNLFSSIGLAVNVIAEGKIS